MVVKFTGLPSGSAAPHILTDSSGVIHGATYQPGHIVSGSWVSIKGSGFTDKTIDWSAFDFSSGTLPTILNGVQVLFNGKPAAVYYLIAGDPQQINVQAPDGLSGDVTVQVVRNGVVSNTVTSSAVLVAPGLFPYTVDNGKTFYPAAIFGGIADVIVVGDPAVVPGTRKARAGDKISLFATGLAISPAGVVKVSAGTHPVTVNFGSVSVPADFSGLVTPGVFQVNFTVPDLGASADYQITITIDGLTSQTGVLFPFAE